MKYLVHPVAHLSGSVRVPGDKSMSHRAVMLGAIADGMTHVSGFLEGEDAISTINAFRALGVSIDGPHQGHVRVQGVGLRGLKLPALPIDCGNSGTSMRLMSGLLAGQNFDVTLIGDQSLMTRPMKRVTDPLRLMHAHIDTSENGRPPVHIHAVDSLDAIDYTLPMASAQVKSCLLLAGLYAKGCTTVTEPAPTRDHTERMLKGFGVAVDVQGSRISVMGGQSLQACPIDVPGDISSAAFFIVAACIAPQADIILQHVGMNPTRIGILHILWQMGAHIEVFNSREVGAEPVADLRIRSAPLHGIHIPEQWVPLAIDEFPVIFVAAANASGQTVLTGAHELRVKESDRIAAMAQGLQACGVDAWATDDGMVIEGLGHLAGTRYSGATVDSLGDHRIAMAFTVASLRASGSVCVENTRNVATSFPGFVEQARMLGFDIDVQT